MTQQRAAHDHPADPSGCDGSCRWRQLYEGNLLSLADLNDKLRLAVGRHGRLRNNVISAMRKAFPSQFLGAERKERRRMSDQSDEVLVHYLETWLAQRPGTGLVEHSATAALREALTRAGFVLPPDGDLTAWARAVAEQSAAGSAPGQPAPDTAPVVGVFDPHTPPRAVDDGPAGPGPVDDDHPSAGQELADWLFEQDDEPTADDRAQAAPSGDAAQDGPPAEQEAAATEQEAAATEQRPPAKDQSAPPLRPQLFPSEGKRTRRRHPKASTTASATPPGPTVDVPQSDNAPGDGPVPEQLAEQALVLVQRPAPLFTSDLVDAGLGSEEEVAAWEQACRDESDSPVRFIPAKKRHLRRGALIIPYAYAKKAPAEFKRSVWAQMLDQFRGARLYEMAVVLHRVQDDLMAADLHEGYAVLRLNQQRGLVGLMITTEADFAQGSESRAALVEGVEELLRNPLTLLGVLCTNHNALPKAITALEEEARERDWAPACPLIAQRSWEFAADRGSSATLVLDG